MGNINYQLSIVFSPVSGYLHAALLCVGFAHYPVGAVGSAYLHERDSVFATFVLFDSGEEDGCLQVVEWLEPCAVDEIPVGQFGRLAFAVGWGEELRMAEDQPLLVGRESVPFFFGLDFESVPE